MNWWPFGRKRKFHEWPITKDIVPNVEITYHCNIEDLVIDTKRGCETHRRFEEWSFNLRLMGKNCHGEPETSTIRVICADRASLVGLLNQLKAWAEINLRELDSTKGGD